MSKARAQKSAREDFRARSQPIGPARDFPADGKKGETSERAGNMPRASRRL